MQETIKEITRNLEFTQKVDNLKKKVKQCEENKQNKITIKFSEDLQRSEKQIQELEKCNYYKDYNCHHNLCIITMKNTKAKLGNK